MGDQLRRMLLVGERILWDGQPYTGLVLRPIDVFLIPFSLLWGGFALIWNASVWLDVQNSSDVLFILFGLPFLVAGFYFIFGRFLIDAAQRKSLRYAITDRRILIYRNGRSSTFKSMDIKRLPSVEMSERSDGSGTIRFGAATNFFSGQGFGMWQPTFDDTPQFLRIPNVRSVYELIQQQTQH